MVYHHFPRSNSSFGFFPSHFQIILSGLHTHWLVVRNMNFIFPIGNFIIPTNIFQRGWGVGRYTTNQPILFPRSEIQSPWLMDIVSMAISGTDRLEVSTIYKAYFYQNFREYPHKSYGQTYGTVPTYLQSI